jgi:urea transport system substrate-binding protein
MNEAGGYRRFVLIGTDHVYPRTTNRVLAGYLADSDVLTLYAPPGHTAWSNQVAEVRRFARAGGAARTAVISTVSGNTNVYFFRELRRQGISADTIPVLTLSIGEAEAGLVGAENLAGHFAAWSYLATLEAPLNRAFLADWRAFRQDPNALTNDAMEATWIAFRLWADAVCAAGSTETAAVRKALAGRTLAAPSGFEVRMDQENHHLHKPYVIGRFGRDLSIRPVAQSKSLVAPEPMSRYVQ